MLALRAGARLCRSLGHHAGALRLDASAPRRSIVIVITAPRLGNDAFDEVQRLQQAPDGAN